MIKRYDPELTESTAMFHAVMSQEEHGDYVLFTDYESLERERDALSEKYNELLYCVANKYEGETRHETAKRIIRNNQSGIEARASAQESRP